MSCCLLKSQCLLSLWNSSGKYVSNKQVLRWFQNFSACLGNTLAKKTAAYSAETFIYYVSNGFGNLNILPRALIWFLNSWDYLFYRRTYYRMLEKLDLNNLTVCGNQSKQYKLRVMKRKAGRGWRKKHKRLTDKQVLTKDFT